MNMNLVVFGGNIGRDAEVRQAGDKQVCSFSLAVKTGWGDNAETMWCDCQVWGKQIDFVMKVARKGEAVVVRGRVKLRTYRAKDGTDKASLQVDCEDVQPCGKRADTAPRNNDSAPPAGDADIPF